MSSGSIAALCPFLEEPGCGREHSASSSRPRWSQAAPGVSPVGGCHSPTTRSRACARASPAPFTCQVLQKLKSSVTDVIGERGGRQELKKKNAVSIVPGRGRAPARKQPREPGPLKGCPLPPGSGHPAPRRRRRAVPTCVSTRLRLLHWRCPWISASNFYICAAFVTFKVDTNKDSYGGFS